MACRGPQARARLKARCIGGAVGYGAGQALQERPGGGVQLVDPVSGLLTLHVTWTTAALQGVRQGSNVCTRRRASPRLPRAQAAAARRRVQPVAQVSAERVVALAYAERLSGMHVHQRCGSPRRP